MKKDVLIRIQAGSLNELWSMVKELEETLRSMSSFDDLKKQPTIENSNKMPIAKIVVIDNK